MSWSQSRWRKWHRLNPGKSFFAMKVSKTIRKNRRKIVENMMMTNSLFNALVKRGKTK